MLRQSWSEWGLIFWQRQRDLGKLEQGDRCVGPFEAGSNESVLHCWRGCTLWVYGDFKICKATHKRRRAVARGPSWWKLYIHLASFRWLHWSCHKDPSTDLLHVRDGRDCKPRWYQSLLRLYRWLGSNHRVLSTSPCMLRQSWSEWGLIFWQRQRDLGKLEQGDRCVGPFEAGSNESVLHCWRGCTLWVYGDFKICKATHKRRRAVARGPSWWKLYIHLASFRWLHWSCHKDPSTDLLHVRDGRDCRQQWIVIRCAMSTTHISRSTGPWLPCKGP